MAAPRVATFGETLHWDLANDKYLQEIYENLLFNYALGLFDLKNIPAREVVLEDALRFADLLTKTIDHNNPDADKSWAQEMICLLNVTMPESPALSYITGNVYADASNYKGLQLASPEYASADLFGSAFHEFEKQYLKIPGSDAEDAQFFRPQKEIYDHLSEGSFSYSGPTSMGKSLIMRTFIKNRVMGEHRENFAIIVPTKALLNEIKSELIQSLRELLQTKNYRVVSSARDLLLEGSHSFIFVMTPERLLQLLVSRPDITVDYLFVDEAHKISSKGERSSFYYKVIDVLFAREQKPRVIFASPNIPNPEIYLELIPPSQRSDIQSISSTFAPVSQIKLIVDLVGNEISVYNDHKAEKDGCGDGRIRVCGIQPGMRLIDIVDRIGSDKQNLVYCSSKDKTISAAIEYARTKTDTYDPILLALSNDIKEQIHKDYYLSDLIKKGVAYHVGYLPSNIRARIEDGFKNGHIRTLFCTSTLIEGVNLPADNLFITGNKNGNSKMTQVEFRNLVGRVGRIGFNLYGNVFLVRMDEDLQVENYDALLGGSVEPQKLSIDTRLTSTQKKAVIDSLINPDDDNEVWVKSNQEQRFLMNRFSMMLAKDIVENRESYVRESFGKVMGDEDVIQIEAAFKDVEQTDDIALTYDQREGLLQAIDDGLVYPEVPNDKRIEHDTLYGFLAQLAEVFKWDLYEDKGLGSKSSAGEYGKLKWYSVVLSQWMCGFGLSQIINGSISYKKEHPHTGVWLDGRLRAETYDGSPEHNNFIIADILGTLENVVLFSLTNYLREFSEATKKRRGVEEIENDWSDIVEYGSTDSLVQFLQRAGFSREVAQYIRGHASTFKVDENGNVKLIGDALLNSEDDIVVTETEDVRFNFPELFLETLLQGQADRHA